MPSPASHEIDLSVAIPVYNNASTLDELIDRLLVVLEGLGGSFELIFVDDGSRDASFSILEARAARDSRIRPFQLVRNFGSQAAVCAAFDQVRGGRVLAMDADLENCPEDIPALVAKLDQGFDLVCGVRENRSSPWLSRRVPSRLMNAYVRRRTGVAIRDIGCGMRAFQSWVVRDLAREGEARRLLTPVFLSRARTIAEVPMRPGAKSKAGGHSFFSLLGLATDYYLLTAKRPFLLGALLSMSVVAVSVGLLLAGRWSESFVGAVGGSLGILVSLVGEYAQRLYHLAQDKPFYTLREPEAAGGRERQEERPPSGPRPIILARRGADGQRQP